MKNGSGTGRTTLVILLCLSFLMCFDAADAASAKRVASTPAKSSSKAPVQPESLPLLVDVGADQCIPCKMMAPVLEDLKKEYAGIIEVKFVDVWKYPEEAEKYKVRGIPTQIFYDASGKELGRHMGFADKESILEGFKQLGVAINKPSGKNVSQQR
jgi:thioredoxin 1